jgi:hypothetical protein
MSNYNFSLNEINNKRIQIESSSFWSSNNGYLNYNNVRVYPNKIETYNATLNTLNNYITSNAYVYYKFNNSASIIQDSSLNNINLTSTATFLSDYRKNSLDLGNSASQKLATIPNSDWSKIQNLTISAWLKPLNLANTDEIINFSFNQGSHPTINGKTPIEIAGTATEYYMTLDTPGSYTITFNQPTECEVLIVGGGGGGGSKGGGGGGGGQVLFYTNRNVAWNSGSALTFNSGTYNINIGSGGAGGINDAVLAADRIGKNGDNTNIDSYIAEGGGGGGNGNVSGTFDTSFTYPKGADRTNAGAGGGGIMPFYNPAYTPQQNNAGNSTNGGDGAGGVHIFYANNQYHGCGGGGGGGASIPNSQKNASNIEYKLTYYIPKPLADGAMINITGTSIGYGGGGGGGADDGTQPYQQIGYDTYGGGKGLYGYDLEASIARRGGGGGGGGSAGDPQVRHGCKGGDGLVIIRYRLPLKNVKMTKQNLLLNGNTLLTQNINYMNDTWNHFIWNLSQKYLIVNNEKTTYTTSDSLTSGTYNNKIGSTNNQGRMYISNFIILTCVMTEAIETQLYYENAVNKFFVDESYLQLSISNITSNLPVLYYNTSKKLETTNTGVKVYGSVSATGTTSPIPVSDIRLKEIISNIDEPMQKIMHLNAFKYVHNSLAKSLFGFDDSIHIGLSAQETIQVVPEAVEYLNMDRTVSEDGQTISKSGNDYLTIRYERLIPLLIECIKVLKTKLDYIYANSAKFT